MSAKIDRYDLLNRKTTEEISNIRPGEIPRSIFFGKASFLIDSSSETRTVITNPSNTIGAEANELLFTSSKWTVYEKPYENRVTRSPPFREIKKDNPLTLVRGNLITLGELVRELKQFRLPVVRAVITQN